MRLKRSQPINHMKLVEAVSQIHQHPIYMNNTIDVNFLKRVCSLPDLLHRVGLGQYARPSCPSPFRNDQKPSWGIFQYGGRWMYKDFATGEVGDEIGLLARINNLDPHENFRDILKVYSGIVRKKVPKSQINKSVASAVRSKPNSSGFGPGTECQIFSLSYQRGISVEGLHFAQDRGVLIFGDWCGTEVYGVKDQTGSLVELRRLDGLSFDAWGNLAARKSHALKGSQKDWPLGILEAKECEYLALAEGLPDFLALHQYVVQERAQDRVGPVGMLSSASLIAPEALEHFRDKHVRIYPHMDQAGIKAADKWQKQLQEAGASKVDFFDFSAFQSSQGSSVKDLCEFNRLYVAGSDFNERTILP